MTEAYKSKRKGEMIVHEMKVDLSPLTRRINKIIVL